jgi:hypothetical protein
MEFYSLREVIKKDIWASYNEHGIDRDLAVAGWWFKKETDHKPAGIDLIFCDSETGQKRVIQLLLKKNLFKHIFESDPSLAGGMRMSFRKPTQGPQEISRLLEVILTLNGLDGRCGSRDQRTDRPKTGFPYVVVTFHFRDNVVSYAEQRNWRLAGPDGPIFLYGTEVSARRRRNFEATEARKTAEAEARASQPTPPPLRHPAVLPPFTFLA